MIIELRLKNEVHYREVTSLSITWHPKILNAALRIGYVINSGVSVSDVAVGTEVSYRDPWSNELMNALRVSDET